MKKFLVYVDRHVEGYFEMDAEDENEARAEVVQALDGGDESWIRADKTVISKVEEVEATAMPMKKFRVVIDSYDAGEFEIEAKDEFDARDIADGRLEDGEPITWMVDSSLEVSRVVEIRRSSTRSNLSTNKNKHDRTRNEPAEDKPPRAIRAAPVR